MKKILSATLLASLLFQVITMAAAQPECAEYPTDPEICIQARRVANEIEKQLPLQISRDMSWESVKAIENTIEGLLRLAYDRTTLSKKLIESGSDMEQARSAMRDAASMVCAEGSPTRSFINGGGAMRYDYHFADGEQFLAVEIDLCP